MSAKIFQFPYSIQLKTMLQMSDYDCYLAAKAMVQGITQEQKLTIINDPTWIPVSRKIKQFVI